MKNFSQEILTQSPYLKVQKLKCDVIWQTGVRCGPNHHYTSLWGNSSNKFWSSPVVRFVSLYLYDLWYRQLHINLTVFILLWIILKTEAWVSNYMQWSVDISSQCFHWPHFTHFLSWIGNGWPHSKATWGKGQGTDNFCSMEMDRWNELIQMSLFPYTRGWDGFIVVNIVECHPSNTGPTILICNHSQTLHLCLFSVVYFHEWKPTKTPLGKT